MKKIKFKYEYLVFLGAYLRNLDLSLDRSWDAWEEKDLQTYYRNFISQMSVVKSLQENSQITAIGNKEDLEVKAKVFSWVKKVFYYFFPLKTLTEEQVEICVKLLLTVDKFLISDIKVYTIEVQKLRLFIADYYMDILKVRLKPKDFSKILSVEHYMQNVATVKMADFKKDIEL